MKTALRQRGNSGESRSLERQIGWQLVARQEFEWIVGGRAAVVSRNLSFIKGLCAVIVLPVFAVGTTESLSLLAAKGCISQHSTGRLYRTNVEK